MKAIREIPKPQLADNNLTMQPNRLERSASKRANLHTRRRTEPTTGHTRRPLRDEQRARKRVHLLHMRIEFGRVRSMLASSHRRRLGIDRIDGHKGLRNPARSHRKVHDPALANRRTTATKC